jgi:TetR/AcrR family transcriptional regulator, mexJK operon transcriptional repressor
MTDRVREVRASGPRRGGRPTRLQAEQLHQKILDVATASFLTQGYGATSIEGIAKRAGVSKRTFYHRFRDKAELFGTVVHRLVEGLRPADDARLFLEGGFEEILLRLAVVILRAALSPDALALHRVVIAEATRFPELAAVLNDQSTRREAVTRIAELLQHEGRESPLAADEARFAAEQFLQIVVSVPQRRALGLGVAMSAAELEAWARDAVRLFLNGFRGWAVSR